MGRVVVEMEPATRKSLEFLCEALHRTPGELLEIWVEQTLLKTYIYGNRAMEGYLESDTDQLWIDAEIVRQRAENQKKDTETTGSEIKKPE